MPPKAKARAPLKAAEVYCRVRPFAESGGHAETDKVDQKTLDKWTDTSVTIATEYMFSKGAAEYTFPKQVFAPEAKQEEVYAAMMPQLIDGFTANGDCRPRNVFFMAYGQTGTGKTHTMFGTDESLTSKSGAVEDGWGVFPRVATQVFDTMKAKGNEYFLCGSAVEFYTFAAADLLNNGAPVLVESETYMPRGAVVQELQSIEDVLQLIATVRANRKARSTKMNQAGSGHEGSSRSHCALILYLTQKDPNSGDLARTHFALIDTAGAERPSKTGEKRIGGFDALLEVARGNESIGAQGTVINCELSMIRSSIVGCRDCHAQGREYKPATTMVTAMMKFIGGCMTGDCMLAFIVCLSPSGANGWETWFSLEYGKDMAILAVPPKDQEWVNAEKHLAQKEKQAAEAMEALAKTPPAGSPSSKYYPHRLANAMYLSQYVVDLYRLVPEGKGKADAVKRLAELEKGGQKEYFESCMNPFKDWGKTQQATGTKK